jgi:hypothetical protein
VESVANGIGDKITLGLANKSVTATLLSDDIKTESGIPIDMFFSARSTMARIVKSPEKIGLGSRCILEIQKDFIKTYRSTSKS